MRELYHKRGCPIEKRAGTIAADSSGNSRGPLFALPHGKEKGPAASYSRTGGSRTTLGDGALDFRVRDGNGYDSPSVATGKMVESLESKEDRNALRGEESPLQMKLEK